MFTSNMVTFHFLKKILERNDYGIHKTKNSENIFISHSS